MPKERDYQQDNELAKKSIDRESEFLKEEVIGHGADTDHYQSDGLKYRENEKTLTEQNLEEDS